MGHLLNLGEDDVQHSKLGQPTGTEAVFVFGEGAC